MKIRNRVPGFPGTPAALLLAATVAGAGLGCAGTEPPVPTRITISPPFDTLDSFGESILMAAAVYDQNGRVMSDATPDWKSTDPSVASVTDSGLVTAHSNGGTTITASAGTAESSAEVTVEQEVAEVVVSPPADTVTALGDSLRLAAEARDANGHEVADVEFSWTTNDFAVALVDSSGLVRGVGEGTATITATAGRFQGASSIFVDNPERAVLAALYEATGGPGWVNRENWLTDAPPKDWYGVRTDDLGRVIELTLSENGLRGPISPELGDLPVLSWLDLHGNDLTGPIPPELENLSGLTWLSLDANGLTGPIPSELGSLSDLTWLYLGNNDLTGPIPPELPDLSALTTLELRNNNLTGTIPAALGNLTNLTRLVLGNNDLTGAIPPELGGLSRTIWLDLAANDLTGPIPPELGNLSALLRLDLGDNRLSGSIPPRLGDLASLTTLDLVHNDLAGPIPPELAGMSALRHMMLSGNPGLAGPLPDDLTSLAQLETLLATGTELCAPTDSGFQAWLARVYRRRIPPCVEGLPLAYLTQATQSRKFPVPLVEGEAALLRVFVIAVKETDVGIPAVRARFYAGGRETHVEEIPGKPDPIPTEVDESDLSKSANAEIPGGVVVPGLEMVIEIDPDEELDSALGVPKRIPETGRLSVEVLAVPGLDLTLIPFIWSEDPDSSIVDLVEAVVEDPGGHDLLWETRTLLPVADLEATAHEPVASSSNNASVLLRETEAIRVMEGGTGHYQGLMSGPVTAGPGAAYLRARSSFSVPSAVSVAHELGHNLGLYHAPCGTTRSTDPSFPDADGSIGAWGYDFRGGGELVHPSTRDLMSYCSPTWIGDYHFANALRYRNSDTGRRRRRATGRGVLLWGGVDAEGTPLLEPAFVVDAPPHPPDSAGDYSVTGRTGDGAVLFSLSFTMPETADGDGSSSFAYVLPAEPGWEHGLASITLAGPGGSVVLDGGSDLPMAILRDPRTGQVRGIVRGGAAVRMTPADGDGRVPPGVEALFSRGIPDKGAWEPADSRRR